MRNKTIEKSITCSCLENFKKVIKKLHLLGYETEGLPLFNVNIGNYQWERGMRSINLYTDKSVKFASNKNLKINDIDFLK